MGQSDPFTEWRDKIASTANKFLGKNDSKKEESAPKAEPSGPKPTAASLGWYVRPKETEQKAPAKKIPNTQSSGAKTQTRKPGQKRVARKVG